MRRAAAPHGSPLRGRTEALRNMLVFPVSEVHIGAPRTEDIARFLADTFHAFCSKAVRSAFSGWFYAWFDEVSATLRCSACRVDHAEALPFSCNLDIVSTPQIVARAIEQSKYRSGIPAAELQESELGRSEDDSKVRLTVFARPLLRSIVKPQ